MIRRLPALLLVLGLCTLAPVGAQIQSEQTVVSEAGYDIPTEVIHAQRVQRRLVWLPSEFGISPRQTPTAQALAGAGTEVWLPDLHGALFIPPGRYSFVGLDPQVIIGLIKAAGRDGKPLYLMAPGRAAAQALVAIRQWQQNELPGKVRLAGAILFHPKLYQHTPQGSEPAEFLPVARASNIPIYLFQPQNAAAFWRLGETVDTLASGGAPVFMHRLYGVSDGFNLRTETRPGEEAMTARLPGLLSNAMDLLGYYGGTPATAAPLAQANVGPEEETRHELLRPVASPQPAPALKLPTLKNTLFDLDKHRGKAVLVNFWATWCPPCVKELPSLDRLQSALQAEGLEVAAVAVGEPADKVSGFLADKPHGFPVLLDAKGNAFTRWRAYAFPTSMILDRKHRIRYAVFGALEWDSDEVKDQLRALLSEKD